MYKKSILVLSLLSAVATLSACSSSGGSNHFVEGLAETPLVSKPLDAQKLQDQAKLNSIVKGDLKNYQITIDDKTYKSTDKIDLKDLGANNTVPGPSVTVTDINEKFDVDYIRDGKTKTAKVEANRKAYLYQQQHSIVGILGPITHTLNGEKIEEATCTKDCDDTLLMGQMTKKLPSAGKAEYTGVAWTRNQGGETKYTTGSLTYNVNFETKKGSGNIISTDPASKLNIGLREADIEENLGFRNPLDGTIAMGAGVAAGKANQGDRTGSYQLAFFGDNAKEIAGTVDLKEGNDYKGDGIIDAAFSGTKKEK